MREDMEIANVKLQDYTSNRKRVLAQPTQPKIEELAEPTTIE